MYHTRIDRIWDNVDVLNASSSPTTTKKKTTVTEEDAVNEDELSTLRP